VAPRLRRLTVVSTVRQGGGGGAVRRAVASPVGEVAQVAEW
jgi:hypothetical protein